MVLIFLLLLHHPLWGLTLTGTVQIENTPIPIPNAQVTLEQNQEQKSDNNGSFSFTVPSGTQQITVKANGYGPLKKEITITQNTHIILELRLQTNITANIQQVIANRETEKIAYYNIDEDAIQRLSESSLFSDVIKSVQLLPGVASSSTFDASLYIRGGDRSEVVGILDRIPIYQPFFFGGGVSIFNPKFADNFDFFPGGFPARYGQSLSGILVVNTKDGNDETRKADLNINLTDLNSVFTGPIKKGRSSYAISVRQTYYQFLISKILESKGTFNLPFFRSIEGKLSFFPSPSLTHQIAYRFFQDGAEFSTDAFDSDEEVENETLGVFKYDQQRNFLSLESDWMISKNLFLLNSISYEESKSYSFLTSELNLKTQNNTKSLTWLHEITYQANEAHAINTGVQVYITQPNSIYEYTRPASAPDPNEIVDDNQVISTLNFKLNTSPNSQVNIISGFLEDKWQLSAKDQLTLGLRLDTVKINDFNLSKSLQPRLSYRRQFGPNTTLKSYIGHYSQQLFKIDSDIKDLSNPTDISSSLSDIQMSTTTHYGSGIEHYLSPNQLIKAELFYKDYQRLPINKLTFPREKYTNTGVGRAHGLELMFHQPSGEKQVGWINYTYSKTERKNTNEWITPEFDLTHMFNLYLDRKITLKNNARPAHIITTIIAKSGQLYTPITNSNQESDSSGISYTYGDQKRFSPYFRIDLWIEKPINKIIFPIPFIPVSKKKVGIYSYWNANAALIVGLSNLLNIQNEISIFWNKEEEKNTYIYDLPRIPIFGIKVIL